MAVTYNMKGTSHPSFAIGKTGPRIFNSSSDPSGSETVVNSDLWIDTTNNQLKIRVSGAWKQVGETISTLSASTLGVSGDATFTGDVVISGDFTVSGTTTSINSTTLDVHDNKITLNKDWTADPTQDAGLVINRGTATDVEFRWNETLDKWEWTEDGSTYYQLGDSKLTTLGFDTSTGILTSTLADGTTVTTDLDGRYITSQTDSQTLSFDSSTNALTISSGNSVTIDSIPTQSGHSGKFLTTDGTDATWGDPGGMPDAGDVWGVITASSDNDIDLGTVAGDASLWNGLDFGELVEKISHSDLSVTTASASGGGSLSYDSSTGVFTFTPPVPGTYTVTQSDVTTHQAALSITESQISDLQSYLTSVPAQTFSSLTGKPTTLAGYGITDGFDGAFSSLSSKPTTLAGYGITDGFDGAFSSLSSKPTTIAGYGITDALQLGTSATTALAGNTSIPSAVSELSNDSAFITNSITTDFTLTNTDTYSDAGPILNLKRDSSSPANADYLGQIKFKGENSSGGEVNYAKITGKILDVTDGSEDGILEFAHQKAGSNVITGRWRSDSLQLLNGTTLVVAGLTYPTSDGSNGQVLTTNGAGTLSFTDAPNGIILSNSAPSSPSNGDIWYDTDDKKLYFYNGVGWEIISTSFSGAGGTEYNYTDSSSISYKVHAFTSSGTFTAVGAGSVDVLIVAGGGGGGGSTAGGGGAGGLIFQQSVSVTSGSHTITVGAGGSGSQKANDGAPNNTNGSDSSAFSYTAIGGGYGYSGSSSGSRLANSGGSGGGGGYYSGNDVLSTTHSGAGTSGQGNRGGFGNSTGTWGGAGGGGAGGVGIDMDSTRAGGAGLDMSSSFGTSYGVSGVFAGGGGGGQYNDGANTPGGTGGGGQGGTGSSSIPTSGTANTGGGGGGGGFYQNGPGGGAGGSGIVLIRYET